MSPVSDAYGKASLVPAVHRLSMCEAAARSCPLTMLDPWEACQPTYTPTLQVLRRVRCVCAAFSGAVCAKWGGRDANEEM
eukprot:1156622-Pelagomonas_calceolata.AAC.1